MIVYLSLLALFPVFWLISKLPHDAKKGKNLSLALPLISLILLLGLRDASVGVDLERYINYYSSFEIYSLSQVNLLNLFSNIEPGYIAYLCILKILNIGSLGYVFVSSSIILLAFSNFIKNYSSNVLYSFFLFITLGMMATSMSTIRQMLAASFFLMSFPFFLNQQYVKTLFLVIIAVLFHYSAIIVFPLLFLFKRSTKLIFIIGVIFTSIFIFAPNFISNLFFNISDSSTEYLYNNQLNILVVMVYITIYLFIYISFRNQKLDKENIKEHKFMLLMAGFVVVISMLSYFIGSIFMRFLFYFSPSLLILIPKAFEEHNKLTKIFLFVFSTLLFIIYFVVAASDGILQIDEYKINNAVEYVF